MEDTGNPQKGFLGRLAKRRKVKRRGLSPGAFHDRGSPRLSFMVYVNEHRVFCVENRGLD